MAFKRWKEAKPDKALAKELSEEFDIDPIVALIASSRGYSDPAELEQFLSDEPCLSDPFELIDIEKAAERIHAAVAAGEKIAVYGDYDCDGVTATAIMLSYLRRCGADCCYYIPDRFIEGYGMNTDAVDRLHAQGVQLIVTVDNGISCAKEIEYAGRLGISVVVTDHHIPPSVLPPAAAVVNPNRPDCPSSFKGICGAVTAFKLVCVLDGSEPEELLDDYADLAALATVSDVMPLRFENRSLVKSGLKKLKTNPNVGLDAIMTVAGINSRSIDASQIAFGIAPRINAAGRMGKAERAVELLLCEQPEKAAEIAEELDVCNRERRQLEKEIMAEAVALIEKNRYAYDRVIVVAGEAWHQGVVGIVASRLMEKYGCPAIVITTQGNEATGSGRSFSGFSLYNAIASCKELLTHFGGHELAAGIHLETAQIEEFRKRINAYAETLPYVPPSLTLDCRLRPVGLTVELAEAIRALEPFGQENREPVFGVFGVELTTLTPIGNGRHLRLTFSRDRCSFSALLFGLPLSSFPFEKGDSLDLAVTVEPNFYNGSTSLTVVIKAMRMAGTNEEMLFSQFDAYRRYAAHGTVDSALLMPTREEVGKIYKSILPKPVMTDRFKYLFADSVGYGKTMIALKTLLELRLIEKTKSNEYRAVPAAQKTDLLQSPTYRLFSEGGMHCE